MTIPAKYFILNGFDANNPHHSLYIVFLPSAGIYLILRDIQSLDLESRPRRVRYDVSQGAGIQRVVKTVICLDAESAFERLRP
jgi:hypothetical protein